MKVQSAVVSFPNTLYSTNVPCLAIILNLEREIKLPTHDSLDDYNNKP